MGGSPEIKATFLFKYSSGLGRFSLMRGAKDCDASLDIFDVQWLSSSSFRLGEDNFKPQFDHGGERPVCKIAIDIQQTDSAPLSSQLYAGGREEKREDIRKAKASKMC